MIKKAILVFVILAVAHATNFYGDCEQLNVALVLDVSSSMSADDFKLMKNFSLHIINQLNVGLNETRIAAMTYSTFSSTVWNFGESVDRRDLSELNNKISHDGGRQNIARALLHLIRSVFRSSRGFRSNVPTVIVIFTNGRSSQILSSFSRNRIQAIKRRTGARVIAVAVGDRPNIAGIAAITDKPTSQNVFMQGNRRGVTNLLKSTSVVECHKCEAPTIFNKCGTACPLTCENPRPGPCTLQCVEGCFCPPGTFLHQGECVESCPVCPLGMVFLECGTACPPTCDQNPGPCTLQCVRGCFCDAGTVLHLGACIPPGRCPSERCPATMEYRESALCTRTCNQRNQFVPCPNERKTECSCTPGMFLHENRCVPYDKCPPIPGTAKGLPPLKPAPQCPETMVFQYCASCIQTCASRRYPVVCTRECKQQCTCPPETYLLSKRCVPVNNCPAEPDFRPMMMKPRRKLEPIRVCPDTMVYSNCSLPISTCVPSNESTTNLPCKPGCTCPPSTSWDSERGCIPKDECPPVSCPPTMVYRHCAPCVARCDQRDQPIRCPRICKQECTCPDETFLDGMRCVKESDCPTARSGRFVKYIDMAHVLDGIAYAAEEMRNRVDGFYKYEYDENKLVVDSINNGGNDMFFDGNKVKIYEDENEMEVDDFQYNRSIRFPRAVTAIKAIHPFFAVAAINNEDFELHDYKIEVTGNYGANNEGSVVRYAGGIPFRDVANIEYEARQVYNTSHPTICEVFFVVGQQVWGTEWDLDIYPTLDSNEGYTPNVNTFVLPQRTGNVLMGYTLLSKLNGELITEDEVHNAMEVLLNAMKNVGTTTSLPEIPKYEYLPRFWRRTSRIDQDLDRIFNNSWYNYTYDDTSDPIDSIENGGEDMFNSLGGNQVRVYVGDTVPEESLLYNQKFEGPSGIDVAVGGSSHPFMTLAWISNQNSYKRETFNLKVTSHFYSEDERLIDQMTHLLVGDFNDPHIIYHYYQQFGNSTPSVCQLFFIVGYKGWNSEGNPDFSFEVSDTPSTGNKWVKASLSGQPRNYLMGYALLSKQNGMRITVDEMDEYLRRLSDLLIAKCPFSMVYSECSGCPKTCENRDKDIPCTYICREGCTCPEKTYLHNGRCVPESQCPIDCPPTTYQTQCVGCPPTCDKPDGSQICRAICETGCSCRRPLVLHNNRCIPRHQCPRRS